MIQERTNDEKRDNHKGLVAVVVLDKNRTYLGHAFITQENESYVKLENMNCRFHTHLFYSSLLFLFCQKVPFGDLSKVQLRYSCVAHVSFIGVSIFLYLILLNA